MGFGVRFKVAPGVRLGVSSRGISGSFGPRVARVRVSNRGAGVSSGIGPFYTYSGTGSRKRRRRSPSSSRPTGQSGPTQAQIERQQRQDLREAEIEAVRQQGDEVFNLHLVDFPPARAPYVPPPETVTQVERHTRVNVRYRQSVNDIGLFDRQGRSRARARAEWEVDQEIAAQESQAHENYLAMVAQASQWWAAMLAGHPSTTLEALNVALSDNEMPSAAVSFDNGEVSVVVAAPSLDRVPVRYVTETPAGKPTTRAYNKTQRNDVHERLMLGHVAVTLREVFAVAPAVQSARIALVSPDDHGDYGVLMVGRFSRDLILGADWRRDVTEILHGGTHILTNRSGRTRQLSFIDLSAEDDLRELCRILDEAPATAPDHDQPTEDHVAASTEPDQPSMDGPPRTPEALHADPSITDELSNRPASTIPTAAPPAAWYPDPWHVTTWRWWDGAKWTHQTSP